MEYINKVTIQGRVGSVLTNRISSSTLTRLSVCTEEIFKSDDGSIIVNTTWHNVRGWDSEENKYSEIKKGDAVYIEGKLNQDKYIGGDGNERITYSIIASKIRKV